MKVAAVADVKARLSAYLKDTQTGPVIVTRNDKAVAVLLAVGDDDELERLVLVSVAREEGDTPVLKIQDHAERLEEADADVALEVFVAEWALAADREDDVGVIEPVVGEFEPVERAHGDPRRPELHSGDFAAPEEMEVIHGGCVEDDVAGATGSARPCRCGTVPCGHPRICLR